MLLTVQFDLYESPSKPLSFTLSKRFTVKLSQSNYFDDPLSLNTTHLLLSSGSFTARLHGKWIIRIITFILQDCEEKRKIIFL